MRTVTLEVSSRDETNRRLLRAFEGKAQGEFISFETPALLFALTSCCRQPEADRNQRPPLYRPRSTRTPTRTSRGGPNVRSGVRPVS
jgi:hypothetical protein